MTAYTFYIDSMVQGYHDYQSIWGNPLADGDLPCECETGNTHIYWPWLSRRWLMAPCKLQLLAAYPACQGKYLQLFTVLHSRETLLQMGKNLDGENLANFLSIINFAKFSQHQSFPPYGMWLDLQEPSLTAQELDSILLLIIKPILLHYQEIPHT